MYDKITKMFAISNDAIRKAFSMVSELTQHRVGQKAQIEFYRSLEKQSIDYE